MDFAAIAFLLSATTLLYVLFGYPFLLWLTRGRKNIRPAGGEPTRTVTVILPVRNGERWVRAKLESIFSLDYPRDLIQILVVSDNSTDRTEAIAREFEPALTVLKNPESGKATAINHALKHATGEILFFTDVRQAIESRALKMLVAVFDDPRVGVASGELVIRAGETSEEQNVGLYWRYEKWIRTRHSAIDSVVGATGAIYAMRRSLARPMPPGTLLDDVHLPLSAFFQGYRIVLVEDARAYDYPTALEVEFRRKVRTLAGVYQVIRQYPELLGPRNRMWVHFMSHKFARLMLPFLLMMLFISSFFLPPLWSPSMLAAQIVFYALATTDFVVPEKTPLKRITSLIRTFVVMVLAAFCATSILFRPQESFWKSPSRSTQSM
jgi:cellulose synthase/poly-beta-1,6-N-acetylglucosamine synthase-like glycosyltransferase